jgi:hypothetical protein
VTEQDQKEYNINLFLNTDYQLNRRIEMLKGIRHNDCGQCWQIEDQGATSLRGNSSQGFIDFAYSRQMFGEFGTSDLAEVGEKVTIDSKILRSHKPFMLEVSLGNTCDLKCMYCNHVYSSQWATESLKNNKIPQIVYDLEVGRH